MTVAFGCVKNTIRLRSGRYFDFLDPQPAQFTLGDIAGALSKICRFGGQVERFYSVAQHCLHCADQADSDGLSVEARIAVLLHDAAEAFCGDVVKPLKVMLPEYAAVEDRVERAIAEKFGVDFQGNRMAIREIDHAMLIAERRQLFSPDQVVWTGENEVRKLPIVIPQMSPDQAELRFVLRAKCLGVSPIES